MSEIAYRLPTVVALRLVGFPSDLRTATRVKDWADHGVALLSGVNSASEFAIHVEESLALLQWCRDRYADAVAAFDDRKEEKDDSTAAATRASGHSSGSFAATLIAATRRDAREQELHGALCEEEAISMIFQILLAGNDSSASTLGSSVQYLCENPKLQRELRESPTDRIPAFIDEILRLESPFAGHFRKVSAPGGV